MGKNKRKKKRDALSVSEPTSPKEVSRFPVKWVSISLCSFIFGMLAMMSMAWSFLDSTVTTDPAPSHIKNDEGNPFKADSFPLVGYYGKVDVSDKEDIALVNLLCAQDLPGAEGLDISQCISTLDSWAARIRSETDRHLYQYYQSPHLYNNSEAYFRVLMLVTVIEQDYGVHYNPMLVSYPSPQPGKLITDYAKDASDIFIHGLIGKERKGTCSSLPVLTVALGRRLGYPLKLSHSTEHLFARWDDGYERFNIDSNGKGLVTHKDAYYKKWPHRISEKEIEANGYLRSMTPEEEKAAFLRMRSLCLIEHGRLVEAQASIAQARELLPESKMLRSLMMAALNREIVNAGVKNETHRPHERRSQRQSSAVMPDVIAQQRLDYLHYKKRLEWPEPVLPMPDQYAKQFGPPPVPAGVPFHQPQPSNWGPP